jgi:hypothetical protein
VVMDKGGVHHDPLKYSFPQRFREAFENEADAFADTVVSTCCTTCAVRQRSGVVVVLVGRGSSGGCGMFCGDGSGVCQQFTVVHSWLMTPLIVGQTIFTMLSKKSRTRVRVTNQSGSNSPGSPVPSSFPPRSLLVPSSFPPRSLLVPSSFPPPPPPIPLLFPLLFIPPPPPLMPLQLHATPWPIAEADCIAAQVTAAAAALSAAEGRIVRLDRPDTGRLVRANL